MNYESIIRSFSTTIFVPALRYGHKKIRHREGEKTDKTILANEGRGPAHSECSI